MNERNKKDKNKNLNAGIKRQINLDKLIEDDEWLKEIKKLSLEDLSYCFMRSKGGEYYSFFQYRVMKEFFENRYNSEKTDKHFVEIYTTLLQRIKNTAERGGVKELKALIVIATKTIIYDISRLPKNSYFIKGRDVPKVLNNDEMHIVIYKEFFWNISDPSVIFSQHEHSDFLRNVSYEDFVLGIKEVWNLLKDNNRKKLIEHWKLMVLEKRLPLSVIEERFSGIVDDLHEILFIDKGGRTSPEDYFFTQHVEETLFEIFSNPQEIVRHIITIKPPIDVSIVERAILNNPDMLKNMMAMLIENYDKRESAKEKIAKINFKLTKKQYGIIKEVIKEIILTHLSIEEIREYLELKGDI